MAKKHFDEYVKTVEAQYKQFKETLEQISKEAEKGMTDINFVENLKQQIIPYQQNYERILYIKYLLDQPVRKNKIPRYKQQIKNKIKTLDKKNSPEAVLEENKKIIESIGE